MFSSQVVPSVQASNPATNAYPWKKDTQLMSQNRVSVFVRFGMLLALPKGDFNQEAEDIHNRWFEVLCQDRVQHNENRAKKS